MRSTRTRRPPGGAAGKTHSHDPSLHMNRVCTKRDVKVKIAGKRTFRL